MGKENKEPDKLHGMSQDIEAFVRRKRACPETSSLRDNLCAKENKGIIGKLG